MASSPFAPSSSAPGHGTIRISLLPPATPSYTTLNYTYPLKLVPSTPHDLRQDDRAPESSEDKLQRTARPSLSLLLFYLSYGGGLLPHDSLSLDIVLEPSTRLAITTQGSTKIFPVQAPPRPEAGETSHAVLPGASQTLHAELHAHSGLLLSPDPTQPFGSSRYTQSQVFTVHHTASLGVLDWVTEGRRARGECWDANYWQGKNEVWIDSRMEGTASVTDGKSENRATLLLRDNVILDGSVVGAVRGKMHGLGVFGTLILFGPLFESLGSFLLDEFARMPRIGGKDWDGESAAGVKVERRAAWRRARWASEKDAGVLWTAARVRGLVLVKFGAREVEGAREWLGGMLREEGSILAEFGHGATMALG
jgi:urease accessory protein